MPKSEVIPAFDVLKKWSVVEMCKWLKKHDFQEAVPYFKEQNITGEKFVYLSEIQLFQMKNVSVKTKNGLKDAQKNVKGRPNGHRKDVIMNSDQPPKLPGKDYHHHTPDVDDDGWGSDFSGDSDNQDSYIEPVTGGTDLYEEPDGYDSEYEEPTPRQAAEMPQQKKRSLGEIPVNKRLPPEPTSPPQPTVFLGNRRLPPEPPEDDENYENPDPSHFEQQDYEQPDSSTSPSPPPQIQPRQPRSPPPPRQPVAVPPRIPRREKPKAAIPEPEPQLSDEDYEQPEKPERSEVVNASGRLRPSDLRPTKNNYTKLDTRTPAAEPVRSWVDNSGSDDIVKPSQLRDKKVFSHVRTTQNNLSTASESLRPPVKTNKGLPKSPVTQSRGLPKTPEKQDLDELHSYTWYHGDMTRNTASAKLMAKAQNGMFLVRKSNQAGSPYALSLFYERVYNLSIRLRSDKKYALGSPKPDEKAFGSVPVLISYFQNNTLLLGGNESTQTTLIKALPK